MSVSRIPQAGGHKGPHPALHHPRPYGIVGWHLRLMPIGVGKWLPALKV